MYKPKYQEEYEKEMDREYARAAARDAMEAEKNRKKQERQTKLALIQTVAFGICLLIGYLVMRSFLR